MNKPKIEYMDAQPLVYAPKQPARQPLTKAEADEILNTAVRNLMETYSIDYNAAFTKLRDENPGLIEGWQAVTKRRR